MFIVLEGIDGSGTTTQAKLIQQKLALADLRTVVTVAEPTGGPIGRLIREQIKTAPFDWATMALLFTADRQWHSGSAIQRHLADGHHVIADRYHLSTMCYQLASAPPASNRWEQAARVKWLSELALFCVEPDLTVVLSIDVATAIQRLSTREARDYYEHTERLATIAALYRDAGILLNERVEFVNGSASMEAVTDAIWQKIEPLLGRVQP